MRVATDILKIGFVVAALPGNVVTATDEQIRQYGWEGKVEDVPDADAAAPANPVTATTGQSAPAGS
jgi:hypothetical protein